MLYQPLYPAFCERDTSVLSRPVFRVSSASANGQGVRLGSSSQTRTAPKLKPVCQCTFPASPATIKPIHPLGVRENQLRLVRVMGTLSCGFLRSWGYVCTFSAGHWLDTPGHMYTRCYNCGLLVAYWAFIFSQTMHRRRTCCD